MLFGAKMIQKILTIKIQFCKLTLYSVFQEYLDSHGTMRVRILLEHTVLYLNSSLNVNIIIPFEFFSAPPSPPGRPVVIDISETKCTLRWEPSEDDGGADVKHYIVEYFRDVWEVWLKAKTTKETQVSLFSLYKTRKFIGM